MNLRKSLEKATRDKKIQECEHELKESRRCVCYLNRPCEFSLIIYCEKCGYKNKL
jgi:hypothetical protein